MTWRQLLGAALLVLPFVALAAFLWLVEGWRVVAFVFGGAALALGAFLLGIRLLTTGGSS